MLRFCLFFLFLNFSLALLAQERKDIEECTIIKDDILRLVEKLQTQRNINIDYKNIAGANHFFENKTEKLINEVSKYLDSRLIGPDF